MKNKSLPINQIICGDATEVMQNFPSESIDLIVTSPPYNAGKPYEERLDEKDYFKFVNSAVGEFSRILKKDGRFCINVTFNINRIEEFGNRSANIVLFPFLSWIDAIRNNALCLKENIIWDQSNSGCDTAWGSWRSPSAPHIRHMTEYIIVGYKNQWKKINKGESDLTSYEFSTWTLDKWKMPTERRKDHPAPFPEELPRRCIKLFSYIGDIVLDPFCGSGTTCVVAKKLDRKYIGIDSNENYCIVSRERVQNLPEKLESYLLIQ